jgi:ketosteroid isomerase-like protein
MVDRLGVQHRVGFRQGVREDGVHKLLAGGEAGAAVTSFRVRHQVSDGHLVCSVVDWTMAPVEGTLSAAEVLEIRDGRIVRGELFYDAEELRKAMPQGTTG